MNRPTSDMLIDEREIRDALRSTRPDATAFAEGVRKRLDAAKTSDRLVRTADDRATSQSRQSEWFRVAASIAPVHLLGRHIETSVAPISFLAISLGKKLVVMLAFPFISFLMLGLTVMGILRIRAVQNGQRVTNFDVEQARRATELWWKRYGWIAVVVFLGALVAPFLGWTTPLLIALVCSGFAAVSFIRTLARENLVERRVIGGAVVPVLGILGQLALTFASGSSQVLDPNLVVGVLFCGAFLIAAMIQPRTLETSTPQRASGKWTRTFLLVQLALGAIAIAWLAYKLNSPFLWVGLAIDLGAIAYMYVVPRSPTSNPGLRASGYAIIAFLALAICSQSLWRGVTASDVRRYVESFDGSQLGMWDDWADAAKWLQETGVEYDKATALAHFQQDLTRKPQLRSLMLTAAVRSNLIAASEILSDLEVQADRARLIDSQLVDQPILGLEMEYFCIAALAESRDLTDAERDLLVRRLMVNWKRLDSKDFDWRRLNNALWLTELLGRLDQEIEMDRRTSDVHRWLVERQVTQPLVFRNGGGFYVTDQSIDSDQHATLAAINLMQTYGVPSEIDIPQLRSYLRPNFLYDLQPYTYVPKVISREDLNHLSTVPPITLLDYLRSELPLWLSIMLVLLLGYATVSSPVRTTDNANESVEPIA